MLIAFFPACSDHKTPGLIQIYTYQVVNTFPHNPDNFTEGLVYENGYIYEGTGRYGASTLQQVKLETGNVQKSLALSGQYFGEGVAIYKDKIFQLTWESHVGFIYDKASFNRIGDFSFPNEGWGLTTDGKNLIMSDGTSTLRLLDPETLATTGSILVTDNRGPVEKLNELEYIHGEIYANVWPTDKIVKINPKTGQVIGWIDLGGILSPGSVTRTVDVLNGIAYDAENDRLFVTGKYWPSLFEIRLVPSAQ